MYLALVSALFMVGTAFAKNDYCKPLEIGQSFTVNHSDNKSKTKVEQKYTLKRESEDVYEAYLNLDFKIKGELKKIPGFKQQFEAKVDGCFDRYEQKLTDELGRTIKLKRFRSDLHSDIIKPQSVSIDVQNTVERSHSRSYFYNVGCSTIIHEALHLMGLADEYEESWMSLNKNPILKIFKPFTDLNEKGPAFDCRALGPQDSVMSNHYYMDYNDQVFFSGQANVILYPNCQQRNDDYFTCSELAYRTSKQNGSAKGCGEVRDICKTQDWVLAEESPLRRNIELSSQNLSGRSSFGMKEFPSSGLGENNGSSGQ